MTPGSATQPPPSQVPSSPQPHTVEDVVQQNLDTILQLDKAARAQRTLPDRVVDAITAFCGSLVFVWVHAVWFGLWIGENLLHGRTGFDPYPFPLLTLIVSLEAIFLSTFILISQNRDSQLSERRNQLDLQINLLAEQENTKMLAVLSQIAEKVGVAVNQDPTVQVLEQATRPAKVVEQIEQAVETTEQTAKPKPQNT
jgi:uncharacterized membrane protein